jgi:hypothetical protein
MSAITLTLPDDLAERLRNEQDRLPEILELGLREINAGRQNGFEGAADVLEFLARLPSPEETLQLRPSERFESRIRELLEKNRNDGLSASEEEEWERYEFLEHLIVIAKARAHQKLKAQPDGVVPGSV